MTSVMGLMRDSGANEQSFEDVATTIASLSLSKASDETLAYAIAILIAIARYAQGLDADKFSRDLGVVLELSTLEAPFDEALAAVPQAWSKLKEKFLAVLPVLMLVALQKIEHISTD